LPPISAQGLTNAPYIFVQSTDSGLNGSSKFISALQPPVPSKIKSIPRKKRKVADLEEEDTLSPAPRISIQNYKPHNQTQDAISGSIVQRQLEESNGASLQRSKRVRVAI